MPKVFQEYKEEAKNRILQKTIEVFRKKGYRRTKMDDIANELGVSKGAIYPYFGSKEELFREALCYFQKNMNSDILEKLQENDMGAADFFDLLMSYEERGDQELVVEICSMALNDQNFREVVTEHMKQDMETYEQYFNYRKKRGILLKNMDARDLSEKVTILFLGLYFLMIFGMTEKRAKEIWEETVSLWIDNYQN
jgi:AcrR family transcriptional regulator